MKYSIIFPYRNRQQHLDITVPNIRTHFEKIGHDFELIIVEQNDSKKFRRANLLNEGAKVAHGDILIFHDIDYVPTLDVEYYDGESDVYLPVKCVVFCYNNLIEKPLEEVPGGYRHFKIAVDDNFFGGVLTVKKELFFNVNGFSPSYVGWGCEEADFRERTIRFGCKSHRNPKNKFLALDHPDSGPSFQDQDFLNNIHLSQNWDKYLDKGVKNQPSKVDLIKPKHELVDKWILATEFDGPPAPTHIVASRFDWGEGEE